MSEDLYPSTPNQPDLTPAEVETAPLDLPDFDILGIFPNLDTFLAHVMLFGLVWSTMYSVLCVAYFYYYNVKHHDRETTRLADGYENGYLVAVKLWASNLVALTVAGLYLAFRRSAFGFLLGLVVFGVYFAKVFWYDLRLLPEIKDTANTAWENLAKARDNAYTRLTQKPEEKKS